MHNKHNWEEIIKAVENRAPGVSKGDVVKSFGTSIDTYCHAYKRLKGKKVTSKPSVTKFVAEESVPEVTITVGKTLLTVKNPTETTLKALIKVANECI